MMPVQNGLIIAACWPNAPFGPQVCAFNHLLGECDVGFYHKRAVANKLVRRFPRSLDGLPFLLPAEDGSLNQWFDQQVRPQVVDEFDGFSLLRTFAEAGHSAFAHPPFRMPKCSSTASE